MLVRSQSDGNPTAEMVAAGQKFLGMLHTDQRSQATIAFTDEERMNWHYIPRERRGVPFKVLTPAQRDAADLLLQNSLSEDGLRKARAIRRLEEVLHARSGSPIRDPELYYAPFSARRRKNQNGVGGWRAIIFR